MKQRLICVVGIALVLGGAAWGKTPGTPEERPAGQARLGQAVVELKSEAGVCLWTVSASDDLVRLPLIDDSRYSSVLLSARFEGDALQLTVAGEKAPLETTSLGQFDLPLRGGDPMDVEALRNEKSKGWQVRVVPPNRKVDTSNCCSCGLWKLSCCPNPNYCMGCGLCGTCCGD